MDVNSFVIGYTKGKQSASGGIELNIAYGDTAPEDTTKLWVKTEKANKVIVSSEKVFTEGGQEELSARLSTTTAYYRCPGCGVGINIYLFGGRTVGSSSGATKIQRYNTETNTLATLSKNTPYKIVNAPAVPIGTKIYVIGGKDYNDDGISYNKTIAYDTIFEFDTETLDSVVLDEKLPVQLSNACASAVGSKIYIFGGRDYTNGKTKTNKIYSFDTETHEIITEDAVLPYDLMNSSCASVGSKIYIFGGMKSEGVSTDILCYDTLSGKIEKLPATLPGRRWKIGCAAIGDVICLLGGNSSLQLNSYEKNKNIWIFDTVKNEIKESALTLPSECADMGCGAVVGTTMYVVDYATKYFYKYILKIGLQILEEGTLQLYPTLDKNLFKFINGETTCVDIGVTMVHKGSSINESEKVEAALYKDGKWTTI